MAKTVKKQENELEDIIILRSVYGKVGMKYFIQPCKDKNTGRLPDCVKRVNSQGDMIMSDSERNSGEYFIPENKTFEITDGTTFRLSDDIERKNWEAIKNCIFIAPDRYAKDEKGNLLIDGTMGWNNKTPRYGVAELYIERPGYDANRRVSKKKLQHNAASFIINDERGNEGRLLIAKLMGKKMNGMPDADVEDYLLQIAEKDPQKIIDLYTGSDTTLRLLFIEARDKKVIYVKNKLYMYADNIVLGATDDAVITWMNDSKNQNILKLIKQDTYPELYKSE